MSFLDNIDAKIGRKPSTTQKFHATLKIYGASNKYYAIVFETSMSNLHESPHCLIFHK
jgi:hypothetical protein